MNWSETYPIFDSKSWESAPLWPAAGNYSSLFKVSRIYNRSSANHVVSTCLYRGDSINDPFGEVGPVDRPVTAAGSGPAGRQQPCQPGQFNDPRIKGFLEAVEELHSMNPEVRVRVYLARDLKDLVAALISIGCEVHLMSSTDLSHGLCSMWRFLALGETRRKITIVSAERIGVTLSDIHRTELTAAAGLKGWRSPYVYRLIPKRSDIDCYKPISGQNFGLIGGIPVRRMMLEFIHVNVAGELSGKIGGKDADPVLIHGARWPGHGFDEWFLMTVIYPVMAKRGMVTFLPPNLTDFGDALLKDIHYSTWMNPGNELIFARAPADGRRIPLSRVNSRRRRFTLREDCSLIVRDRPLRNLRVKVGSRLRLRAAARVRGDVTAAIRYASKHFETTFWADVSERLHFAKPTAELFLDRHLGDADVAVSGWYFMKLDEATSRWALSRGAERSGWEAGMIKQVPKLEGPMSLWRSDFARKFDCEWILRDPGISPSLMLGLMHERGEARIIEVDVESQGWTI